MKFTTVLLPLDTKYPHIAERHLHKFDDGGEVQVNVFSLGHRSQSKHRPAGSFEVVGGRVRPEYHAEGSLWTSPWNTGRIEDYDGVYDISRRLRAALEASGFDLSEIDE